MDSFPQPESAEEKELASLARDVDGLYRALHTSPGDAVTLRKLARLCVRLERWEEARTAYTWLAEALPGDSAADLGLKFLADKRREISTSPINYGTAKHLQFSVYQCFHAGTLPEAALCEVLTETATLFPGTNLRLIYAVEGTPSGGPAAT